MYQGMDCESLSNNIRILKKYMYIFPNNEIRLLNSTKNSCLTIPDPSRLHVQILTNCFINNLYIW